MNSSHQTCPACEVIMDNLSLKVGRGWKCSKCGGKSVSLHTLKMISDPEKIQKFWLSALQLGVGSARTCPSCRRKMQVHYAEKEVGPRSIHYCTDCLILWFDVGEFGKVPVASDKEVRERLNNQKPIPGASSGDAYDDDIIDVGLDYGHSTSHSLPSTSKTKSDDEGFFSRLVDSMGWGDGDGGDGGDFGGGDFD